VPGSKSGNDLVSLRETLSPEAFIFRIHENVLLRQSLTTTPFAPQVDPMKSIVFASFVAGSLGALAVLAIRDGLTGPEQGHAQEFFNGQQGGPTIRPAPRGAGDPRLLGEPPLVDGAPFSVPGAGAGAMPADVTDEERVNIAVYESCNRSVVNINTKVVTESLFFDIPSEGAGSGSVLDQHGHILTNNHVVEGAQDIQVTLYDGKNYAATLVGKDPTNDIAVIRIEAPPQNLFPVAAGDSKNLRVGQNVYAIGNPFGLERTLTTGIISSLNRSLPAKSGRTMKSIIQIDAAINPGNSGGPLLDSRGRLIGMNTAIASRTGQNTGVGFAIPVNTILRVVTQLIENGAVIRPEIGVSKVFQTEKGLLVAALSKGGPAEQAGLRGPKLITQQRRQGPFVVQQQRLDLATADLIIGVNGQPIKTGDDFLSLIEAERPGADVLLNIVREGQAMDLRVRLGQSRE
jgi:S1-C subfamily serine protease